MKSVDIVCLEDPGLWGDYLTKLGNINTDIYYSPEYYLTFEKLLRGKAYLFTFQEGNKIALYPFILRDLQDLKFDTHRGFYDIEGAYGYNGVISNNYSQDFIKAFYREFNAFCSEKGIIAEFTRFHPILKNWNFSGENMEVVYDRRIVFLDLQQGYEKIWEGSYNRKTRNKIRKAKNDGIVVDIVPFVEGIDDFKSIYFKRMQELSANDFYIFNKGFFHDLIKMENHASLLLVKKDGIPIGAMILFHYSKIANNFLSADLSEMRQYNIKDILQDTAIKIAIDKNCNFLNLGGGNSSYPEDSLLKFKSKFSNSYGEFYIGKKIHNAEIYHEVVSQWEKKNADKKDKFKSVLLKYHY
jgi:hypothetical protein